MRAWAEIEAMAEGHHGGGLAARLESPLPPEALVAIPDDRWLSRLSQAVFSAGFNWRVVESKWPAFEEAFHGFQPGPCSMMDDEACEKAAKAGGIGHVRKALAIRNNAVFFRALADEHGSAAACFAQWPAEDYAGLLLALKKRGDRLGGTTAQYALRMMGRDGYILTGDVVAALIREGIVDKAPSSAKGLEAVQRAFNAWQAESGRPLSQISRLLALSVG